MEDIEMDEELLAEFIAESNENLGEIEQQLLELETNPDDAESVNGIFRAIHTVKGTCGFLGLSRLEALSHAAENLLGKIRSEKFSVSPDLVSLLLEAVDAIKSIIAGLEETGAEPTTDYTSLSGRLKAATRAVEAMARAGVTTEIHAEDGETELRAPVPAGPPENNAPGDTSVDASVGKSEEELAEKKSGSGTEPGADQGISQAVRGSGDAPNVSGSANSSAAVARGTGSTAAPQVDGKGGGGKGRDSKKAIVENTIRVDVDVVDDLMNQVGELVLTRNRLLQMMTTGVSPEVQRIGHHIDHTTTTLQEQVLRLRMQPVAGLWNRLPRVVRDLSRELGKKIRVVMEGQETELDRFILAALRDPMTHIIRNSCDHGVEVPADRIAAGKPEEGTIRLSARQQSGNILIEISDDGKGIDAAVIKAKAVKMDLISRETAERMSDHAALQLIFHPGLSTAEKVSKVSGRGVGMDVVQSEIKKTGGNVEVESEKGQGSTLRMRIPLTLAIIPALVAEVSGQQFAVPQMNVQELLGVTKDDTAWEEYAGSHFYRLRDKLLPVISLAGLLHLAENENDDFTVVVINAGQVSFGLTMDRILGAEEIVVKPLGVHFRHLAIYAGCSILGDGGVVPIFDCNGLMEEACLADGVAEAADEDDTKIEAKRNLQHIVLFEQAGGRYAIPMSLVQRLETIASESVEVSADREVLQYRDAIISFQRWSQLIGKPKDVPAEESYEMACIILSNGENNLCLEVERILDVAEVPLEVELGSEHSFFLGSAVIHGQATEVVDVYELAKRVAPEWFGLRENAPSTSERPDLLLVEDSVFFRDLLRPTLTAMGYQVWVADDALHARSILDQCEPKVVLTDLDMKGQQGMELVRWMKKQECFRQISIVALASFEPKRGEDKELFAGNLLLKSDSASLRARLGEVLALGRSGA